MAVNKNFVIKNGIEVAGDLIIATSELDKVGIGSTIPTTTLDIGGVEGLKANNGLFVGILTAQDDLNVGSGGTTLHVDVATGNIGVGTADPDYTLHVVGTASTTAVDITGDVAIHGNVTANNIGAGASVTFGDLNVTGITTVNDIYVNGTLTAPSTNVYGPLNVTAGAGSTSWKFDVNDSSGNPGIGITQAVYNPTLYFTKGFNYRFELLAPGHPFYIKTVQGTGTGNAYEDGVEGNGTQVGFVTFKVPFDAPDTLYYQCSNHSAMVGTIIIGSEGVGIQSGGTSFGSATDINFVSTSGAGVTVSQSSGGISTVSITPGASLGLVIALSS